jgi:adenylate cyclase
MLFKKVFLYRLYLVFVIAAIWVLFSLLFLYNIVKVDKELLETRRLGFFSLAFAIIGFVVAGAEAFYLKNAFRRFPLWLSTILRMALTFTLFLLVSLLFLAAYFVFRYNGTFSEFNAIYIDKIILTPSFLIFMVDMGVLAFLSILILEVSDKYGPGGVRNLLRGRYNKPRKEARVFLFLDMNDSTAIAERLGHERYFNMLKEFFADITDPILENDGSIYQYVGDEVSISWKNTPENKLKCLSFVRQAEQAIMQREAFYLHKYGVVPLFKTGIHAGDVTAGYIGIIKKELVFSGDTLNTTARIRSLCHSLGHAHVLSHNFFKGIENNQEFRIAEIGEIELRGREEKEKLYALQLSAS